MKIKVDNFFNIYFLLMIIIIHNKISGQILFETFQASGECQRTKNVNCVDAQTSYMNKDNIRATFRYAPWNDPSKGVRGYSLCTGTMINQFYDAGGVLRQYFITFKFLSHEKFSLFIYYHNYKFLSCWIRLCVCGEVMERKYL